LLASSAVAQQSAAAASALTPITLHVQFRLSKGRFAVDKLSSEIRGDDALFAQLYAGSKKRVAAQLIDRLDSALAKSGPALALSGHETCPVDGAPDPAGNRAICTVDKLWTEASNDFRIWVEAHHPDYRPSANYLPSQIFSTDLVGGKLEALLGDTSPFVVPDDHSRQAIAARYAGQIDFPLKAPIAPSQITACHQKPVGDDCILHFADPASARAFDHHISLGALADVLKPLEKQPWDMGRINRQLSDLLTLIGIQTATVDQDSLLSATVSPETGSNHLVLTGPPRLSAIQIALTAADAKGIAGRVDGCAGQRLEDNETVRKILYLLLSQHDYAAVIAKGHVPWVCQKTTTYQTGNPIKLLVLGLPGVVPAGALDLPYVNQRIVADKLAEVKQLGYQAQLETDAEIDTSSLNDQRWALINVFPADGWNAAAPGGDAGDASKPAAPKPAAEAPIVKRFRNMIAFGGGAETYRPASAFIEYHREGLIGSDSLDARVGYRGKVFVDGAYNKDFVDFMGLGRRLTITVAGASAYNPTIPVGADRADERRNGGSVAASYEILRDANRHWLGLRGEFGEADVAIDPTTPATTTASTGASSNIAMVQRLSYATLGLSYAWLGNDRIGLPVITLDPSLTRGWGGGVTKGYWKASVQMVAHANFADFLSYDGRWSIAWASPQTPLTELPRLGGDESLRGFRQDAASGRLVWSLQNEVWLPLRFSERLGPAIDGLVRNDLKFALFADVGRAAYSLQAPALEPVNVGVGAGLRYTLQNSATLRLDFAHLVTGSGYSRGRQGVYFSIVLMPFHY